MGRFVLTLAFATFLASACLGQAARPASPEIVAPPKVEPDLTNPRKPFAVMVGDPAPPIAIKEYILGEPVASFERGHVYLILLWNAWDERATSIMPRLTELQNARSKDGLVIIGATSPGRMNTRKAVEDFVFGSRTPIGFQIAWDSTRVVMDSWLNASGRTSMPAIFIVDREGRVAFIGGVQEFEKPLAAILEQTNDLELDTRQYYDCISASWAFMHFEKKIKNQDWGGASSLGREIISAQGQNCFAVLNNIAWLLVDPKNPVEQPDLELALLAASRADELVEGKDSDTIDTLARIHYLKGDLAKAVELQERAVALARSEKLREPLHATLEQYRNFLANKK